MADSFIIAENPKNYYGNNKENLPPNIMIDPKLDEWDRRALLRSLRPFRKCSRRPKRSMGKIPKGKRPVILTFGDIQAVSLCP